MHESADSEYDRETSKGEQVSARHFVDRKLKLRWLAAHRELWEGWIHPGDPRLRSIIETMRDAGLFSKTAYWKDVALNNLIQDTRTLLRTEKFKPQTKEKETMSFPSTPQPDLRTLEGAKDFLNYHAPDENQRINHENVNNNFQVLLDNIWEGIPDGPGKTLAIRSLNRARMDFNSAIANHGG